MERTRASLSRCDGLMDSVSCIAIIYIFKWIWAHVGVFYFMAEQ